MVRFRYLDIKDAQQKISEMVFSKADRHTSDIFIKNEPVTSNNIFFDQHLANENPALTKWLEYKSSGGLV